MKKKNIAGAEIANAAAQICNLKNAMASGNLTSEQMEAYRDKIFLLRMGGS